MQGQWVGTVTEPVIQIVHSFVFEGERVSIIECITGFEEPRLREGIYRVEPEGSGRSGRIQLHGCGEFMDGYYHLMESWHTLLLQFPNLTIELRRLIQPVTAS